MKKEFFTIDIFDATNEEGIFDGRYSGEYDTFDAAITDANKCAMEYADAEEFIMVTIFGGEYKLEGGDIVGEPIDVYCASNKGRKETMELREKLCYSNTEVDFYVEANGQTSI